MCYFTPKDIWSHEQKSIVCGIFERKQVTHYAYNDVNCTSPYPFVCKAKALSPSKCEYHKGVYQSTTGSKLIIHSQIRSGHDSLQLQGVYKNGSEECYLDLSGSAKGFLVSLTGIKADEKIFPMVYGKKNGHSIKES